MKHSTHNYDTDSTLFGRIRRMPVASHLCFPSSNWQRPSIFVKSRGNVLEMSQGYSFLESVQYSAVTVVGSYIPLLTCLVNTAGICHISTGNNIARFGASNIKAPKTHRDLQLVLNQSVHTQIKISYFFFSKINHNFLPATCPQRPVNLRHFPRFLIIDGRDRDAFDASSQDRLFHFAQLLGRW